MTPFDETDAGAAFIATAASRETSEEIMQAIAFFAGNEAEAVTIWEQGEIPGKVDLLSIWENATNNGAIDDNSLDWGDDTLAEVMAEAGLA